MIFDFGFDFTDRRNVPEYRQRSHKICAGSEPRQQRRHHKLFTANVGINKIIINNPPKIRQKCIFNIAEIF